MHTRISMKVKKMADLLDCYKKRDKRIFLAIFNWKIVSFLAIVCQTWGQLL